MPSFNKAKKFIERHQMDRGLLLAILFLIGLGVVQVYSASFIFAIERYDDGLYFFKRQLMFAGIATLVLLISARLPWKFWQKVGGVLFLGAVIGVALTYIPGLGVKVGGAHRWLQLPMGFRIEPSEFLKMTFPFIFAWIFARSEENKPGTGWLSAFILVATPLALTLKQPDFGTFAICSMVFFAVWFAHGVKWRYVFLSLVGMSAAFYFLIINVSYRKARLLAFLDPWADPEAKGFQIIQSLLSFYSGGISGAGLGQGQGKLFFLPEAHTDFTLAVLGEETGFLGVLVVLGVYGYIIFRGFQITANTDQARKKYVALGITLTFALAFVINTGMSMGLLPTKGLSLPFLSYGGSALLANALGLGILLNIDRQTRLVRVNKFKGIRIHRKS